MMTAAERFPNLRLIEHPLIQHKLSHLRDRNAPTVLVRQLLREIALLMGYEVTRDLPTTSRLIETPLETMEAPIIAGKKIAVVAVLRAGLGMADGILELIPGARVGHIGLYRDHKTHRPIEYFVKMPDPEGRLFIVADPMLATGYSAAAALAALNSRGVPDSRIRFVALVTVPEGLEVFFAAHPTVPVYAAALDRELNENAYILPGLGDAGDRLFGTK